MTDEPITDPNADLDDLRTAAPAWPLVFAALSIVLGAAALARTNSSVAVSAWYFLRQAGAGRTFPSPPTHFVLFAVRSVFWLVLMAGGVLLLRRWIRAGLALHWVGALGIMVLVCLPGAAYALRPRLMRYPGIVPRYNDFQKLAMMFIDLAYPAFVLGWLAARRFRPRPAGPGRVPYWPTVVGVVSMVWAGGELLRLAALLVGWLAVGNFAFRSASPMAWALIAWHGLAAAVWLGTFASGWLVLRRRRRRGLSLPACAAALAVLFLALPCLQVLIWRLPGPLSANVWPHIIASVILPGLGRLIYPAAVLVWFARPAVRAEARSWASDDPAGNKRRDGP